ncbi:MAG: M18 family aminopeptidase, partial [Ilumatobacteraceae bacterium]
MAGPHTLTDLVDHLDASPSPFHAVRSARRRLDVAGFDGVSDAGAWDGVPARGYIARDGALIAWVLPAVDRPDAPFRLVGAHTDSPGLRIKPNPDSGTVGWRQLGVEVYGGVLLNSWLDRDLGIAGRVVDGDGSSQLVDVRRPVARVPQLAIHLDRGVNDGLKLDPQQHVHPVWGTGTSTPGAFAEWLADTAGIEPPAWWELCLYDIQGAAVLGGDVSLLASGRLDNQVSCWAATVSLAAADPAADVAMIVLTDHEAVGSASTTGASGPLLEHVLERLVIARGGTRDDLLRALGASTCV